MKRGACIAAAVMMLGACGQSGKENAAPETTAAAETMAEEDAVPENREDRETSKKETPEKEETSAEDNAGKDDAKDKEAEDTDSGSSEKEASEEGSEKDREKNANEDKEDSSSEEDVSPEKNAQMQEQGVEGQEIPADVQQENGQSIRDIYDEICQKVDLDTPMLLPDDFIVNYYGIDISILDEYVFSMSEAATSAETVVIFKAKDAGSTDSLSASLKIVIDQKRSEMENYLPEQFQIVDKSSVQVKGNYVYLVISENADAISQIIQANLQ